MSKKIKRYSFLLVIVTVLCFMTGCDAEYADYTREIRHSGFSVANADVVCPSLDPLDPNHETIRFLLGGIVITNFGTVYQLSPGQLFSNETNCMKSNLNKKVVAVFDQSVFKCNDNLLYRYSIVDGKITFNAYAPTEENYTLYNSILSDPNVVKVITVDSNSHIYYALKNDGNVYSYMLAENNKIYTVASSYIVFNRNNFGSKIIDFNYVGNSPATFIRTSDRIYRMFPTNKDECTKYVDIQCKYKMSLDEGLTNNIDKIWWYDGSRLMTTYGKSFTVAASR